MKKIALLTLLLFLFGNVFSQNSGPDWLRGNWTGDGFQPNTKSTWNLQLDFEYSDNLLKIKIPVIILWGVLENAECFRRPC